MSDHLDAQLACERVESLAITGERAARDAVEEVQIDRRQLGDGVSG